MQKKIFSKLEKIAPAKVISYNRTTNRAEVQILPQDSTSTGEKLPRRPLVNIPALNLGGGGFVFSFPIQAGDVGWIFAADKDISVFKQLLQEYAPNTYRKHRYDDSFFIPDNINGFTISADDAAAVLLSSLDGTTKISVKNGQVSITATNTVVNATAATINAPTTINGDVTVNGTLTASTDVVGGGISLKTHTHGGVTAGGASTGAPQ